VLRVTLSAPPVIVSLVPPRKKERETMDIPCTICGEPFDMDELHYIAEETNTAYDQVREKFYRDGCNIVLGSATRCRPTGNSSARFALADILGSDIDGYASLAEDFDL
jgi:hypothetical protein